MAIPFFNKNVNAHVFQERLVATMIKLYFPMIYKFYNFQDFKKKHVTQFQIKATLSDFDH